MRKWMVGLAAGILLAGLSNAGLTDGAIPDYRSQSVQEEKTGSFFSFRNGIGWGMQPEEIREREGVDMIERSQADWSIMDSQQPVEVSRFHADLVYMFHQNQLKMITYDFGQEGTGSDFQYLQGALAAVYGEMREADAGEVVQLMDQIYPGYYSEPLLQQVCGWTAEDGTPIYLYYYADGAFAILYASAEIAQPGAGQYMINGL